VSDIPAIRKVDELAFGREGEFVEAVREANAVILSLVAVEGEEIVGHILFSPVMIEGETGKHEVAGLAPLAVFPTHQKKGIGKKLTWEGLKRLKGMGIPAVIEFGHPEYYPAFGFVPAREFDLTCEYPEAGDAFMALELEPGWLAGKKGLVRHHPVFKRFV
jgi:putative acetyltransferase